MKIMNENYDLKQKYIDECQQHVNKVYEWCMANNIPFIFAACVTNGDGDYQVAGSHHFCGPGRTPPTFLVAETVLHRGVAEGMQQASGLMLIDMLLSGPKGEGNNESKPGGNVKVVELEANSPEELKEKLAELADTISADVARANGDGSTRH